MNINETIAAVSTPVGEGGIGIVRISGPEALLVASRIFHVSSGISIPDILSHTIHYGWVYNPDPGHKVDEALLLFMKAPRSYTGEDVVEIHGHGGIASTSAVLQSALAAGARLAEAGEFTRRAFINGRIDLAQAEAVIELIRAKTEEAHKAILSQLSGHLSREVKTVKDKLMELVAETEASLDFEEDEFECISDSELVPKIKKIASQINNLSNNCREGSLYLEGLKVVIAGRPNVGKSSLLNALVDEDRAIVTPHPGTTRDTVEGMINLRGIPVILVDCAGIRDSKCAIETVGVQRSVSKLMESPLVIMVADSSEGILKDDLKIFKMIKEKKHLIVINKIDLPGKTDDQNIRAFFPGDPIIKVSCKTRKGLDELKESLFHVATGGMEISGRTALTANLRHREVLRRATVLISSSLKTAQNGFALDAISADLRLALETLGEITGETATEDILDTIFNNFCIGK